MVTTEIRKVLIIQTASLGDVILSTALAESLHAAFPECRIDYLVKKGYESLFSNHPCVHTVWTWDKKRRKTLNLLSLILKIRRQHYDAVVNVQRFFSSGLITALSGAQLKSGFSKNPLSFTFTNKSIHIIGNDINEHEINRNLKLIHWIGNIKPAKPTLWPSDNDFRIAGSYASGVYITISPASLWTTKQYPAGKWIDFLGKLPESIFVILLGSPEDRLLCDKIATNSKKNNLLNLAGKLTFLQSAALMKGAAMNFVNDSAPLHLCSAVNARVTAIFCSTIPAFGFGPLSDDSEIIEAYPAPACRPCGLHGYMACPEKHFNCAEHIRTEQLMKRVKL